MMLSVDAVVDVFQRAGTRAAKAPNSQTVHSSRRIELGALRACQAVGSVTFAKHLRQCPGSVSACPIRPFSVALTSNSWHHRCTLVIWV